MEPDRPSVEHQAGDVGKSARPEAAGLGQVDHVSQLPPQPLLLERLRRHRRIAALGAAAAAAAVAVRQMGAPLRHVDRAAVGSHDALTMNRHEAALWRSSHTRYGPPRIAMTAPAGISD